MSMDMVPGAGGMALMRAALRACVAKGGAHEMVHGLTEAEFRALALDWPSLCMAQQLPPALAGWRTWLVLGGRGGGKTRTGAEWVKGRALGLWPDLGPRAERIAIIAPNMAEARLVMIEGPSGLLAVHPREDRPVYHSSKRTLTWNNGTVAQIISAEEPDQLRGPQFDAAWCDELAKWKRPEEVYDMLLMALRLGEEPRAVITTTLRPIPILRRLIDDPTSLIVHAPTAANRFLARSFRDDIERRYAGTRLGRQELDGEIITDDPDALFRRDWIEKARVQAPGDLSRIVVAVDPPAGKGRLSRCGIVCAGLGSNGRFYVLDDATAEARAPLDWARRAVALYHAREADRVIAEVNQGGEMVGALLREIDGEVPVKQVRAMSAKRLRAEPVASLYQQGRVSHVGAFPELEDEMCAWTGAAGERSPDRLDALVWALAELSPKAGGPRVRVA